MDKLVKFSVGILAVWLAFIASADIFSVRTPLIRNVPIPDTAVVAFQIGYEPTSGVHVAYYSGGTSNILVWTDGTWITNKFIEGFNGSLGLALTSNRIYGRSSTNMLHEYTWPGGVLVTNVSMGTSDRILRNQILVTATNKMIIVGEENGGTNLFHFRGPDGEWKSTNIGYTASSAVQYSYCQGSDEKIYTLCMIDGNPPVLIRLWESNSVLEFVDGVTNLFNPGEFPSQYLVNDPVRNLVVLGTVGRKVGDSFDYVQFTTSCGVGYVNPVILGISNNLALNNIGAFTWSGDRIQLNSIIIPGTNGLLHFTEDVTSTNECTGDKVAMYAQLTYASTNISILGNRLLYGLSSDRWTLYRGRWNQWILERLTAP